MKTRLFNTKIYPFYHAPLPKSQRVYYDAKVIEGPESPQGSNCSLLLKVLSDGLLFRILSDKVLFRILRDSVSFKVLSDRALFKIIIDSVFFRFLSGKVFFNLSLMSLVLFYILNSKRPLHLTIILTCIISLNKTDRQKQKEMLV